MFSKYQNTREHSSPKIVYLLLQSKQENMAIATKDRVYTISPGNYTEIMSQRIGRIQKSYYKILICKCCTKSG